MRRFPFEQLSEYPKWIDTAKDEYGANSNDLALLDKGYRLMNFNDNYLYYVLGEAAGYHYPTADKVSSGFHLFKFSGEHEIDKTYSSQI